MKVVEK